jgi:hypothetical protein
MSEHTDNLRVLEDEKRGEIKGESAELVRNPVDIE